jgi:hypothetical protein
MNSLLDSKFFENVIKIYSIFKKFLKDYINFLYQILDKFEKKWFEPQKNSEVNVTPSDVISKQISEEELISSFIEVTDVTERLENKEENFAEAINENGKEIDQQIDTLQKTSLFRRILNRIRSIIRRKKSN